MTEPDLTCAVCGGTWGEPFDVQDRECRADCHDEEKWKALDELVQQLSKYKARIDWLERRNGGWL